MLIGDYDVHAPYITKGVNEAYRLSDFEGEASAVNRRRIGGTFIPSHWRCLKEVLHDE